MENPWVMIIGITVLVLLGLFITSKETFSSSGLTISNADCHKLSDIYVNPHEMDPMTRANYEERICDHKRRDTVDYKFGNYYTVNGMLI